MKHIVLLFAGLSVSGCAAYVIDAIAGEKKQPARAYAAIAAPPPPERGPQQCDEWLMAKDAPIVPLFNSIRALGLKKGEYESSIDFEARAHGALDNIRAQLTRWSSIDRVVVTAPLSSRYDADRRAIFIGTYVRGDSFFYREWLIDDTNVHNGILATVIDTSGVTGSYVGSNAFGVTRQVSTVRGVEYGLQLTDIKRPRGTWVEAKDGIYLPSDPERAKAMRAKVGMKIVANLVAPGALSGRSSSSPTISSPTDEMTTLNYVTVATVCAAIVAMDNGEILRRLR